MAKDDEIKLIAYNIWEEEGCLHGYDREHWLKAEAIWEQVQKEKVTAATEPIGTKLSPKKGNRAKAKSKKSK